MTVITFMIPKRLWLTSNRPIANHAMKARIVRDLHLLATIAVAKQGLGEVGCLVAVEWEVRYPKGVRLDKGEASNAQPTTKAILDGLVLGKHLPDDGPKWVSSETFRRGPNLDVPGDHQIILSLRKAPTLEPLDTHEVLP